MERYLLQQPIELVSHKYGEIFKVSGRRVRGIFERDETRPQTVIVKIINKLAKLSGSHTFVNLVSRLSISGVH